jgi:small GTP-binding protein
MENLLKTLLKNYMMDVEGVTALSITDREGLVLASEIKGESEDEEVMGAISAVMDSSIDRIKSEFGGENVFFNITTTGGKKIAICGQGPRAILSAIADPSTSDVELKVYSEHIAGKAEQLLVGNDKLLLEIPAIIKAIAKTRGGKLPKGEFSMKLIVTGIFQVGKTSLIKRYVENRFQDSYISTIGVEISKKTINFGENTEINFVIWDIAGQSRQLDVFRARFYNGANAAIIVVDRTRMKSLESIQTWYDDIKKSIEQRIPIVIVGNKSDLEDLAVSEEDIAKAVDEFGFHYILTSAKTGENVQDCFNYIAIKFLENTF